MKKIFFDSRPMDKRAREDFGLTEELMMENAAAAMEDAVTPYVFHESTRYIDRPHVLILCGAGNNGADGYALARRLVCHEFCVTCCVVDEPKSELCKLQKKRAELSGVMFTDLYSLDDFIEEKSFDITVVVDCIFGAGFRQPLPPNAEAVLLSVSKIDCRKISCDIPTGLDAYGNGTIVFKADETVTMGSLKLALYSDRAKDCTGKITLANLGISKTNFEHESKFQPDAYLLEKNEMTLPWRRKQNANKGTFGHAAIASGEKPGAANIAANAAINFGAGLVTLTGVDSSSFMSIMASKELPSNTSALLLGSGFGRSNKDAEKYLSYLKENKKVPFVLDADIFYYSEIKKFLEENSSEEKNSRCILTPHPKEFSVLLENCGLGNFSTAQVVEQRYELAKKFTETFKGCILILKGTTTTIAHWSAKENRTCIYLNPHGTNALAKAGSGDVLAGLCTALLAQGYNAINAAITASLAHSLASKKYDGSFALTPEKLIDEIGALK
ncbi:NAD(P)H-hydrate epimerase [Treponema sp.]|uniref:NAD(P)H-hydrate epimerase n=1 Tax=Treponema sp. TaxID=166 RepID=UPI00298E4A61|nr:NAD(P)H-hydrate epimerase [Treponema sp.]MCQ2241953.1 NAD(P)H-hydrate epimerase [Treponema sp.]